MPLTQSHIVKSTCSQCGKVAKEVSSVDFGDYKFITLECGHVLTSTSITSSDASSLVAVNGDKLMPFQIEAVSFTERASGRVLIADEQGLGKTPESLAVIALHLSEMSPILAVTKTTLKAQWMHQAFNWVKTKKVQIITSSKEMAIPGFDIYVITYDILKKPDIFKYVTIKTMLLDECQAIKNHTSDRALAVQTIAREHNIEYIMGLSGTPIKNHAGEYFTILNLLMPSRFPEYTKFVKTYCDYYEDGWGFKVGGLRDPDYFHSQTKDFILRRTQEDVLPDLFALKQPRKFHHVELDKKLVKAYASAQKELEALFYDDESEDSMTAKIAVMTKMRQIAGISKVFECTDFVSDFLESTDRRITIFAHHHSVVDLLEKKLNEVYGVDYCTMYRAGDNREAAIKKLSNGSRVLIASALASGEGFDGLQHLCNDMILLERQWNPANEEQVEGRIARIGQTKPCSFIYMIASDTIDEYFTQLVEEKRAIVASTMDNKSIVWNENSLMKELAEIVVKRGGKKWTL